MQLSASPPAASDIAAARTSATPVVPTYFYASGLANPLGPGTSNRRFFVIGGVPTIDKEDIRTTYLKWIAERQRDSELLLAMYRRRKAGPECDAIWSGHWALRTELEDFVKKAQARGCLLHVGVPGALA